MSYLEKTLVEAVYGESTYKKVSFLEPSDFTNSTYKYYWELLSKHKGDLIEAMATLELTQRKELSSNIYNYSTLTGLNNLDRVAFKIIETRFKRLLINLLTDLSKTSKNRLEVDLLNECILAIHDTDIFELSDSIIDYVGSQASAYTKQRIKAYLEYIDKRCKTIKDIIDAT